MQVEFEGEKGLYCDREGLESQFASQLLPLEFFQLEARLSSLPTILLPQDSYTRTQPIPDTSRGGREGSSIAVDERTTRSGSQSKG